MYTVQQKGTHGHAYLSFFTHAYYIKMNHDLPHVLRSRYEHLVHIMETKLSPSLLQRCVICQSHFSQHCIRQRVGRRDFTNLLANRTQLYSWCLCTKIRNGSGEIALWNWEIEKFQSLQQVAYIFFHLISLFRVLYAIDKLNMEWLHRTSFLLAKYATSS